MSETKLRANQAEGVAIWPLPASAQQALPDDQKDEAVARAAAAERDEHGGWVLPQSARSTPAGRRVERRFGTRTARRAHERVVAQEGRAHGADRLDIARAANAEVRAQGETPVRQVPDRTPAQSERTYFFTARESDSPYNFRKLDKLARAEGVGLLIDRDRNSETYGLRYVVGEPPAALAEFRTPEAREAHEVSKARLREERALTASAANTLAPTENKRDLPLSVPNPDTDYEGFKRARGQIRQTGSADLEKLIETTRQAHEELLEREDAAAVQRKPVQPDKLEERSCYERGMILAQKVLEDRAVSGERQALAGERAAARAQEPGRQTTESEAGPADADKSAGRRPASGRRTGRSSPDLEQ